MSRKILLISLILTGLHSCTRSVIENKTTSIVELEEEYLKSITADQLVDTLLNSIGIIILIQDIPENFCQNKFKEELHLHVNKNRKSAMIGDYYKSKILKYKKSILSDQIELLEGLISNKCDNDK